MVASDDETKRKQPANRSSHNSITTWRCLYILPVDRKRKNIDTTKYKPVIQVKCKVKYMHDKMETIRKLKL